MLRKLLTLLFLMTLISTANFVFAQETLTLNEPVQGDIAAEGERDTYFYEGVVGETVAIHVNALPDSRLDTVLELYDSAGNFLSQNDDRAPGDSNSTITFTFPADDTYQIVVRGYASKATGAYEIVVTAPETTEAVTTTPDALTLDQTTTGSLEAGDFAIWHFTPQTDGAYRISLDSVDFDTQLRVLDSTGAEVAFDDDSGTELNAFINRVEMRAGETYTVEVRSYLDEGEGSYELTVTSAPAAPKSLEIQYGETVDTELIEGVETVLSFQGAASDIISVSVTAQFDAYAEIQDEAGNVIASDDDSGGNLQPLIASAQLPEDGTYTIVVRGYNSYDAGPFTVTLSKLDLTTTPSEETISYGQTVEGFLPAGQPVSYTFTGTAGDVIFIEVDSNFDAYLEIQDTNGTVLASDDDSGFDLNPLIEGVELPADGEYRIILSGFASDATGSYSLTLSSSTTATESGTIAYGTPVEGNMTGGEPVSYTFEGSAGDVISVTVETQFDSYLELQDANGDVLTSDDDSGGALQPAITDFALPETGTYRLVLSGFSTFDEGPYTISLNTGGGISLEGTAINYGETVQASIDSGGSSRFNFTGAEGDVVTISVDAPFDGLMELYNESGEVVASDDDSGGNLNPKIENFTLPTNGEYTIVVTAFGGATGGEFSVTLESGSTTTPADEINFEDAERIEYGATVGGNLENAGAIYAFAAEAGDVITVSAESEFDGLLEIYSADGTLVTQDDDSGTGLNPLIEGLTLENAGDYYVVLTSFEQSGRGAYTLTLSAGETAPPATVIEAGQTLTQPLAPEGSTIFVFNGEAGQKISLSASPVDLNSDLDLYIEVLSPTGELLAADDDSGWRSSPALVGVELAETGTYQINVQSFTGAGEAEFTLALESGAVYLSPSGQAAEPLPLQDGQATLSLTLDAGKTRLYSFEAAQENILIVNAPAGISVEVYAADGSDQILENGELIIPADDTYFLVVYAAEAAAGDVQVSLFEDIAVEPVKTAGGLLAPDATVHDSIERGQQEQWTFAPVLTGEYTFVLNSEDSTGKFDPYLVLMDTEGNILAEDDDSGGNFNALIADVAVIGGTKLILEVRGFDNNSAGDYFLAVVTENLEEAAPLAGGEIAIGEVRLNTLQPGQQAEFTLNIAEAGAINITVDGLTLPYVDVYDEAGELVTRGTGSVKALELEPGAYNLVVYDRLNRAGNFSVRITTSEE